MARILDSRKWQGRSYNFHEEWDPEVTALYWFLKIQPRTEFNVLGLAATTEFGNLRKL